MRHQAKKRWTLVILLVALPVWIVAVATVLPVLALPKWAEMIAYTGAGILWALPFKSVFRGVGQADPDAGE